MVGTVDPGEHETGARPTVALSALALFQISIFWFTTNAIWGGLDIFQQERAIQLLGKDAAPGAVGVLDLLLAPFGMLVMPIMGSVSDYASTRWGRRKPFVLVGALGASIALVGLALAPTFGLVAVFFVILSVFSNIARGPFSGLVPDLVPERQVGLASGLMGLMVMLGIVGGFLVVWSVYPLKDVLGLGTLDFGPPMIVLAVIVAATGIGSFLWIPNGPPPKPRDGRPWTAIALETFGTDILESRDYVYLLCSRFFIMMGGGFFMNLNVLFLLNAFGMNEETRGGWIFAGLVAGAVGSTVSTLPGARLGNRIGRKPVIYGSAALGAVAIGTIALAPTPEIVIAGVALLGLAFGAFLAVDWALMTQVIPMASAGRYMGFSNIVDALNGPLASALGAFTMSIVAAGFGSVAGGRIGMLVGVAVFGAGIAFLVPVHEPGRGKAGRRPAGEVLAA